MIYLVLLGAAVAAIFVGKLLLPTEQVVPVTCPTCNAVNKLRGAMCPDCNTREQILLRTGTPAGSNRVMQIVLYHCGCNSRMIFCDLKCSHCGAQISHDRRTELRPMESDPLPLPAD